MDAPQVGPEATPDTRALVEAELAGPLAALGLDLEAVELTPSGRRRLLRVAVDKDGGVTLDDVAEATRAVSAVLDDSEALGEQPYTLEVTSRGVDRPLTAPRHWRRNEGRLVRCRLTDGTELLARIGAAEQSSVRLTPTTRGADELEVAYADIAKALVQVEFSRPRGEES